MIAVSFPWRRALNHRGAGVERFAKRLGGELTTTKIIGRGKTGEFVFLAIESAVKHHDGNAATSGFANGSKKRIGVQRCQANAVDLLVEKTVYHAYWGSRSLSFCGPRRWIYAVISFVARSLAGRADSDRGGLALRRDIDRDKAASGGD